MGTREALGLPNIGFDALSPTLRSGLTEPRHTTSILSSVSAQKAWEKLHIWPNEVAEIREKAHLFVAKNSHFRLSFPDCGILQGFPKSWQFSGAVYQTLGQIGNAVPPPIAYQVEIYTVYYLNTANYFMLITVVLWWWQLYRCGNRIIAHWTLRFFTPKIPPNPVLAREIPKIIKNTKNLGI
ncbi:MAG: DNA cytosine methyltransferase [Trichodesmium sp. MAG_R02]|jgi:DNA (cytosine-5)-methyltransferase 1|nr:DNA cytosine methyltransferase [Trichodesmium sp. MAG_R02]